MIERKDLRSGLHLYFYQYKLIIHSIHIHNQYMHAIFVHVRTHLSPLLSLIPLPLMDFLFPISPSYFSICFVLMIQRSPLQLFTVAWLRSGIQQRSQHGTGYIIDENASPSPSNQELHRNTQEMVGLISSFSSHKRTLAGAVLCR